MRRNPKDTVVGLLLIGLSFIVLGWMAETLVFAVLGEHGGNAEVFDVIESAALDGEFADQDDENDLQQAVYRISAEATSASMERVRSVHYNNVWLYVVGIMFVIAGGVKALRIPTAVRKVGE